MKYDVVIIGAGTAGLMAAVAAGGQGARTLLLDKGDKPGRKLGISGGGRCNVTNAGGTEEIIRHLPGNGRFLHSAFSRFGSQEIIAFFEGLGIPLKEEDRGRMFPVTDKASTVVHALVHEVRRLGVEIRLHTTVAGLDCTDGRVCGVRLAGGERIAARTVVVATGGKSVPKTGSTGDGYRFAEAAGHTITELYPTEVPLTSREPVIASRELQGLALKDVALTVWNAKGKAVVTHEGDMLFTHFGLSGPAALRCSQFIVKGLKQTESGSVRLTLDLYPALKPDELMQQLQRLAQQEPRKALKNALKPFAADRLIPVLLRGAEVAEDAVCANVGRKEWQQLAEQFKAFPLAIHGTLSIEEAFVTGGGVSLKEIDPRTMGSKVMPGLYFCGEVLDVHGYTGGYNITAAFASGHSAGSAAAEEALALS